MVPDWGCYRSEASTAGSAGTIWSECCPIVSDCLLIIAGRDSDQWCELQAADAGHHEQAQQYTL